MKVSTKTIKSQELGFLLGNQVIFIEGVTKKMKDTVMVKCIGLTEVVTKVSGKMEFSMVLARCRSLTVAQKKVFLKTTYTNNQQQIWPSKTK
jgi:hypothetical protein